MHKQSPLAFALSSWHVMPVDRGLGAVEYKNQCPRQHYRRLGTSMEQKSDQSPTKRNVPWKCMQFCGACCKLGDFDEEVLQDMLQSEGDVVEYLDMVGEDGWCKWLDSTSRKCTKYADRPRFCRATPAVFEELYKAPQTEFDEFAKSCCEYHISNSFGEDSNEADRYQHFKELPFEHTPLYGDE